MRATALVSFVVLVSLRFGQTQMQDLSATPTIQVKSSLTLVDVIAQARRSRPDGLQLLTTLKREDFRIFDNGREMPIESVDIGAESMTRPIALWLIVECEEGVPPGFHSTFMSGKTQFLKPALVHLAANDSIGVAHWCNDGTAQIDLSPRHDSAVALAKVEEIVEEEPTEGIFRTGELSMQRMIRLVLKETAESVPQRLPVFLFLYGDHCATHVEEADSIATDLLERSSMVYGINDGAWPFNPNRMRPDIGFGPRSGMIFYLVHYYSDRTGGEVFSTGDPKLFSASLDSILSQLHLRYTIGFKPEKLDGKRHTLKVSLTSEAHKRFPSAELRFRPEYIPVVNR